MASINLKDIIFKEYNIILTMRKILPISYRYNFKHIKENIFQYNGKQIEDDLEKFIQEINNITDNQYNIHTSYNILEDNEIYLFPDYYKEEYIGEMFE